MDNTKSGVSLKKFIQCKSTKPLTNTIKNSKITIGNGETTNVVSLCICKKAHLQSLNHRCVFFMSICLTSKLK